MKVTCQRGRPCNGFHVSLCPGDRAWMLLKKVMAEFIGNLEPVLRQLINLFLIILILVFVLRPLLNYLAVNRKIEYQKRILKELKAENGIFEDESTDIAAENGQNPDSPSYKNGEPDSGVNDFTPEQAEAIVKKTLRDG
ncbi:hypothetical protein MNBD_DELTA03-485 [hydrothermal vent metagenome]|uniref:Uncharacterized protein n=1 Tax=hydrothermal vent metagenome TaxID=652676 RepID=A0A3B0VQ83_9ZZZZ